MMMDDWEDAPIPDFLEKKLSKSKWDDEDLDNTDVKASWEDEDEPVLAPKSDPTPEEAQKKVVKKSSKNKGKTVEAAQETPLDPIEEKLRNQRWFPFFFREGLVEETDYQLTCELFAKKGLTESEFGEYAKLVADKLRPYEKSYHYIPLLKAVMRLSLASLNGADTKEVASSVTAVATEKIKAEKEANAGKKKTGGKKKQLLHVGKPEDDLIEDAYDNDGDYYDFM